jgi:hypothetical protein
MKQARAPCPQAGNNLWTVVHPRRSDGPCSVRRAGSSVSSGRSPSTEGTLGAADRRPRRGGGREAVLGELGKCAGLFNRRVNELATEGARVKRIGVSASHPRDPHGLTSYLVACPAKADLALTRRSSAGVTTAR